MNAIDAARLLDLADIELAGRRRPGAGMRASGAVMKCVLLVIAAHSGEEVSCWSIAARVARSEGSILCAIAALERLGLVERLPLLGRMRPRRYAVRWGAVAALAREHRSQTPMHRCRMPRPEAELRRIAGRISGPPMAARNRPERMAAAAEVRRLRGMGMSRVEISIVTGLSRDVVRRHYGPTADLRGRPIYAAAPASMLAATRLGGAA